MKDGRGPRWVSWLAAGALLVASGGSCAVWRIGSGLSEIVEEAEARFEGDRVEALMKLAECDACAMGERNRAVWALGRLEDERAVPLLLKHQTGRECDHARELCQETIGQALAMIERKGTPVGRFWLWAQERVGRRGKG